MGETIELFISGFCRTSNESRTVCCEYEKQMDGSMLLTEFGCRYETCPNQAACRIYEEAMEQGGTRD